MAKNRAVKAVERESARAEVRGVLKLLKKNKALIDYRTLADTFGMFSGGSELAAILSEIQEEDDEDRAGLKCALVVGVNTGLPGKGFFAHAREKLKRAIPATPEGERAFWLSELAKLEVDPASDKEATAPDVQQIAKAIENTAPNAELLVKRYMKSLVEALVARAPGSPLGDPRIVDIALRDSLSATTELVHEFFQLSETIAGMNSRSCANAVYVGLGEILAYYEPGRASSTRQGTDAFDYYRFLGHELLLVFTVALIAEERWDLLDEVLRKELFVEYQSGDMMATFAEFSSDIHTLVTAPGRSYAHSDLLKERHSLGALGERVPMKSLVAAESLLFLRGELIEPSLGDDVFWRHRSAPYITHQLPSYIVRAESASHAGGFLKAVGASSLSTLRESFKKCRPKWSHFYRNMATPPLWYLDLSKVGTRA